MNLLLPLRSRLLRPPHLARMLRNQAGPPLRRGSLCPSRLGRGVSFRLPPSANTLITISNTTSLALPPL